MKYYALSAQQFVKKKVFEELLPLIQEIAAKDLLRVGQGFTGHGDQQRYRELSPRSLATKKFSHTPSLVVTHAMCTRLWVRGSPGYEANCHPVSSYLFQFLNSLHLSSWFHAHFHLLRGAGTQGIQLLIGQFQPREQLI